MDWTKNPPFGLETITLTNEPNPTHPYVPRIRIVEFTHQNKVEPILASRHNCPPHHGTVLTFFRSSASDVQQDVGPARCMYMQA